MGFLIKKYVAPEPGPRPSKKAARKAESSEEPVIVHKPSCRDEAALTVRGLRAWDKQHLAQWEDENS
jgi:hypothetical protein